MELYEGDYIYLDDDPSTPVDLFPTKAECKQYEYIKLSQLCKIAAKKGIGGSRACNAFGGDKGKYKVISERKVRAVMHKSQPRKYVLTTAAFDYLKQMGLENW
jgi:hypothetical protein